MIMCVLLCYPVSIRIYYQQGVLFLVGRRGYGYEDESFGGVSFDIIFCMSRFNHEPSGDTLRRDAIASFYFYKIYSKQL